jgi:acetoacetyl-CoA synthetase
VAALTRNSADPIVACLASTALGAVWSSVAPDLGTDAMLRRFEQFRPIVLFAHTEARNHGVIQDLRPKIAALLAALPCVRHLVLLDGGAPPDVEATVVVHRLEALAETRAIAGEFPWAPRRFNDPLFVMFSSGTTGPPKGIVHGVGGTLLEHVKEHRLHSDFGPGDRLLFQTTCGWMMWNWMLSALASGVELVVYDGSVSFPGPDAVIQLLARERVTVLGTSPAYIELLRASGVVPRAVADLSALRALQSTGSILFDGLYDWIHANMAEVPIQSISGGTDIIGCFVLGNPDLPVHRGEAQCISLGCDVRVLTEDGAETSGAGELVCASPFPSRPVAFLADPERVRYHAAYFVQHPGLWWHGDFVTIHPRGSVRLRGRSDGVLNIRGVRIGPAEIYAILQDFPQVAKAIAVEQRAPAEPGGVRLVVVVTISEGVILDRPLTFAIKKALADRASRTHVPAVLAAVPDLPTTFSGKLSESAVREALNGDPVRNLAALRNPECLDAIRVAVGTAR